MRIGIDAKWYFTGPPSTQTVLQNLLPPLFAFYPEHEWFVFLDKNDKRFPFPFTQKNILPLYVWANNNMLSNIFILPKHIRHHHIDTTVFQTFPPYQRQINSIAFIHDVLFRDHPEFFTWKERLYFRPLSWFTPSATRLITTTEFVANELLRHRFADSRSKIDIIPLGVSPEFKPIHHHDPAAIELVRKKHGLPNEFILFVGRLNARKNIGSLLKALYFSKDPNIPLVIVGSPDGKNVDVNSELEKHKDRIILTGSVSKEELPMVYATAKVFCFPSFAEGFGLPPLEAMASGVPVVVSNAAALSEVCGDAAIYIDPSDPKTIAEAINRLQYDPRLYDEQRRKGLKRAAQYDWNTAAHQFMQTILKGAKR